MESQHFLVYFHQRTYELALRVTRLAEEAHKVLVPYAQYAPKGKTHVIIMDDTDQANGSASTIPRNVMTLLSTPPAARGTLNDADDWLRGLIFHEYMHILHLDTKSWVFDIVNTALGKFLAPNLLMPTWWIEGWATFVESHFTGGGRNRSSYFDMYIRSAILSKKAFRLDQATHQVLRFPRGITPYLYGSRFLTYIANKYGKGKLTQISLEYGNALIPYGMNFTAKSVLKKTYLQLWKEWLQFETKKYNKLYKRITRLPLTKVTVLTKAADWLGSLRYSANGERLLYNKKDGKEDHRILSLHRKTRKIKYLFQVNEEPTFTLHSSGHKGILSQTEISTNLYAYYDLYSFSPKTGSRKRLTHRARAKDPTLSPDGKEVIFVKYGAGRTALWRLDLRTQKQTLLFRPKSWWVLTTPRFSPNGKYIICSVWFPGGFRDLVLFNRKGKLLRRLTRDRAQDIEPTWTHDGKEIIYSSDISGTYNLYSIQLSNGKKKRLTNELYGAFSAAVSPKGTHLAFLRFTPKGFVLAEMPYSSKKSPYPMPSYRKKWPTKLYKTPTQIYPVRTYQPSETIFPLQWAPVLASDYLGTTLGLQFSGTDILNFHSYSVGLSYGFSSNELSFLLNYRYQRWYPTYQLVLGRTTRLSPYLQVVNGRQQAFWERLNYAQAGVAVPFRTYRSSYGIFLNYGVEHTTPLQSDILLRPADMPPVFPRHGFRTYMNLQLSFSNTQFYADSISSERGRRIELTLRLDEPHKNFFRNDWSLRGRWNEFIGLPWGSNHVLAFQLTGGIGQTSQRGRSVFFLGGLPSQDLFQSILSGLFVGAGYLRGYPVQAFRGNTFGLLQVEYRMPVLLLERGLSTLPLYFRRIHIAFYADVGHAFDYRLAHALDWQDLKVGVGGEIRLEWTMAYYVQSMLRLGFAKGLMKGGFDHLYLLVGFPF